ncbi:MAG: tRNA epoxyqueuosine(34) reductase QueG [Flavobacteriales bacterium]|jgi:epoxyqueuosine reductase
MLLSTIQNRTDLIKTEAKRLGFMECKISKAGFLEEEAPRLEEWLANGSHGKMSYMENHFDKRLDPTKLVEGAKSVISLSLNYYSTETRSDIDAPKISMYAYGRDYHKVIKAKLKALINYIHEEIGEVGGRAFVDSAPVMDKAWAVKSGIGWMGKHSNVLSKKTGSFYFISELILDLELSTDSPVTDHCGECTACIDACPTGAIIKPYVVDGSKCISYFTIELKDEIFPKEYHGKFDDWVFGCDICQEVCPWNRFSKQHKEPDFYPHKDLLNLTKTEWEELTEDVFQELFKGSAVKRTKYQGLKRNIGFLSK